MDKKVTVSFSIRSLLTVAFALLFVAFFYAVKEIIVLFAISYILASAMRPFVNRLHKYKIPKPVSIVSIYLLLLLVLFLIFRVLVPPVSHEVSELIKNRYQISDQINNYFAPLPDSIEDQVTSYLGTLPDKIKTFLFSNKIFENVLGLFAGFGGILTIMFVAFYMLLENSSFERFISKIWPGDTREKERVKNAFQKVDLRVSMWVRGQIILSFAVGLLMFVGYTILGLDYALVLALIAAFTEIIPYAGPILGAIPAVAIAFLSSPLLAVWVVVLVVLVQQFEQHVLVPQVMKRAVGISAVAVIFSLLVGAKLFGILGAIIAVPIAAGIKVLYESLILKRG